MAQLKSYTNQTQTVDNQSSQRLMPIGEYRARIVDVKIARDKDNTRNKIVVTFARSEKEFVSPRLINAQFDIWHPNATMQGYGLTDLYFLTQAVEFYDNIDTDHTDFVEKIAKALMWKEIFFTVQHLTSQKGNSFHVAKNFKIVKSPPPVQKSYIEPPVPPSSSSVNEGAVAYDQSMPYHPITPSKSYETYTNPNNRESHEYLNDDVPF